MSVLLHMLDRKVPEPLCLSTSAMRSHICEMVLHEKELAKDISHPLIICFKNMFWGVFLERFCSLHADNLHNQMQLMYIYNICYFTLMNLYLLMLYRLSQYLKKYCQVISQ